MNTFKTTYFTIKNAFLIVNLLFFSVVHSQQQSVTLLSGSSWTAPAGVYSITVECYGGGGGGGGGFNTVSGSNGQRCGSGGGGGGYTTRVFAVTPGVSYNYSVGAGGAGGSAAGGNGTAGGTSTFTVSGITITATGGGWGAGSSGNGAGNGLTAGTGGTGTNGTANWNGGIGGFAGGNGAGGGGGAGTLGNGTNGTGTTAGLGGSGNLNGNGGAATMIVGTNGFSGKDFAGGGGGGNATGSLPATGGKGGAGIVRITYCIAPPSVNAGPDVSICLGSSTTLNGSAGGTTTLFSENFETAATPNFIYGSWLNDAVTTGNTQWYFSNTLPINGSKSLSLYNTSTSTVNSYFISSASDNIAYTAIPINAVGYTNLKLSFKWQCAGQAGFDYGKVVWSTNGTTWTDVSATQYQGQTTTQSVIDLNLSAANGQVFYLGFRWINNNTIGTAPGFKVDDISVTGTPTIEYTWTPSTGLSSTTISNPIASPTTTQTYFLNTSHVGCPSPLNDDVVVTVVTNSVAPTGLTGLGTFCAGSSVTLTQTGGSLSAGANYEWFSGSCGGTLVGSGNSITVSPSTTTTYFVRASIGTTCSATLCVSGTVIINPISAAPTGMTGTGSYCAGSSVTLTQTGGMLSTGANYEWYTGSCGGTLIGTGNSINVSPSATTTYFVRVSTGTSCPTTACFSGTVTIVQPSNSPTAITGLGTYCAGNSVTLTQTGGTLSAGASYQWYTGSCGGTLVGTGNSITLSPSTTTTYFVRASAGTTCPATACISGTVTVNPISTTPSGIMGSGSYCAGSTVTLTQFGGALSPGANYEWYTGSCGGTLIGTANSITVTPSATTTYFVRVSAGTTCPITSCISGTVTIVPKSVTPTGMTGTGSYCAGSTITLTQTGGSLSAGANYEWFSGSCGGTLVGTGNSITISPSSSATYHVRASAGSTCPASDCFNGMVTIVTNSIAPTSISGIKNICHGNPVKLTPIGGTLSEGATYEWFSGSCGGTLLGTGNNITVTPTTTTNYFVRASTGTTCPASICANTTISLPIAGNTLAGDSEKATCVVNQNGYVHFYHSSGRLLASINSNGQNLGYVDVTAHVGPATNIPSCNFPSNYSAFMGRRFVINPSNQPTSPVDVIMYFDINEFNNLVAIANSNSMGHDDLTVISDITISKYSGPNNVDGIASNNCPGAGGNGGTTLHTQSSSGNANSIFPSISANARYVGVNITSFSEFWFSGNGGSPLATELYKYSAQCSDAKKVTVSWSTASEINCSVYSVFKSSDGINWEIVDAVPCSASSNSIKDYEIQDNNRTQGITYYRLVETNLNGDDMILETVSISCEANEGINVFAYPNPTESNFTLEINTLKNESIVVELFDITGKIISRKNIQITPGTTLIPYNDLNLIRGSYSILVKSVENVLKPIRLVIR